MTLVLGVDGGGSRTRAGLFRTDGDGRLEPIASGASTGSNPYSVGWEAAHNAIVAAVAEACAGQTETPDAAVLAIAGCGSEEARARLAGWADGQRIARRVAVEPDTAPILAAAPRDAAAVGLIAGTGASAIARRESGETQIVGGWGYLIDDTGSGYALGRDALRRLAQLADAGAAADALSADLLRHAGVTQPHELKAALYGAENPRAWIANLAPVLLRLSESGDPIAGQIVADNIAGLTRLARDAATRAATVATEIPPIYFAGALLASNEHYRGRLIESLVAEGWAEHECQVAPDGIIGCALLAVALLTNS